MENAIERLRFSLYLTKIKKADRTVHIFWKAVDDINSSHLNENEWKNLLKNSSSGEKLGMVLQSHEILLQKGFNELLCLGNIKVSPKPWQLETAIKALNEMQGNVILADEVGLGKTIEAGLIVKELLTRKLIRKVLILVPAPLVEQWKLEMSEKFDINLFDYKDRGWDKSDFIISSLPYASRSKYRREQLQNVNFDLVVVDEAHSLKNHKTTTYKFVYGIKRKNTILMSATPIQNDLRELFNLVNILKPGYFKSRKMFSQEYIADRFTPKNVKNLKKLIGEVMIRHRRSNTLVELPRRNVKDLEIVLDSKEKEFHDAVIQLCRDLYMRNTINEQEGKTILTLIGLLKQNCSSPQSVVKYLKRNIQPHCASSSEVQECQQLIDLGASIKTPSKARKLINQLKKSDDQCIVYSEFTETIFMLERVLKESGLSVVLYHGSMTSKQKENALKRFKNGQCRILISSESGSQGLNLQHCHILYNYDLPWNPMRVEQRIGRVHRFGQQNEVDIYTMTTKGTVDEYILYILTSKVKLFEMVIGELDTIMSYVMDEQTSIEVRIGKTILESANIQEIEHKLKKIGEELAKARNEFKWDQEKTKKMLRTIEVDDDE